VPEWGAKLRNLYWFLRDGRHYQHVRRKYYRRIADEKKRLQLAGVDGEAVRLYCRYLSNPRNDCAAQRFLLRLGYRERQMRLFD